MQELRSEHTERQTMILDKRTPSKAEAHRQQRLKKAIKSLNVFDNQSWVLITEALAFRQFNDPSGSKMHEKDVRVAINDFTQNRQHCSFAKILSVLDQLLALGLLVRVESQHTPTGNMYVFSEAIDMAYFAARYIRRWFDPLKQSEKHQEIQAFIHTHFHDKRTKDIWPIASSLIAGKGHQSLTDMWAKSLHQIAHRGYWRSAGLLQFLRCLSEMKDSSLSEIKYEGLQRLWHYAKKHIEHGHTKDLEDPIIELWAMLYQQLPKAQQRTLYTEVNEDSVGSFKAPCLALLQLMHDGKPEEGMPAHHTHLVQSTQTMQEPKTAQLAAWVKQNFEAYFEARAIA